jgi:hypothetical protein
MRICNWRENESSVYRKPEIQNYIWAGMKIGHLHTKYYSKEAHDLWTLEFYKGSKLLVNVLILKAVLCHPGYADLQKTLDIKCTWSSPTFGPELKIQGSRIS